MLLFCIFTKFIFCNNNSSTLQCHCTNIEPKCIQICKQQEELEKQIQQNNKMRDKYIDTIVYTKLIKPVLTIVKKYKDIQSDFSHKRIDTTQPDIIENMTNINLSTTNSYKYVIKNQQSKSIEPIFASHVKIPVIYNNNHYEIAPVTTSNDLSLLKKDNIDSACTTHMSSLSLHKILATLSTNDFGHALSQNFTTILDPPSTNIYENILTNKPFVFYYKSGPNSLENDFSSLASKESGKSFYNHFKTKESVKLGEALPLIMSRKIAQSQMTAKNIVDNVNEINNKMQNIDKKDQSTSYFDKKTITKTITKTLYHPKPIQVYASNTECYGGISFSKTYVTTVVTPYITILTTEMPSTSYLHLTTSFTLDNEAISRLEQLQKMKTYQNTIQNFSDFFANNFDDKNNIQSAIKIQKPNNIDVYNINDAQNNQRNTIVSVLSTYTPYITRFYTEYPNTSYKTVTESYTETPLETIIEINRYNNKVKTSFLTKTMTVTIHDQNMETENGISSVMYKSDRLQNITDSNQSKDRNENHNAQENDKSPNIIKKQDFDDFEPVKSDTTRVIIYKTMSRTKDLTNDLQDNANEQNTAYKSETIRKIHTTECEREGFSTKIVTSTAENEVANKKNISKMSEDIKNFVISSISVDQEMSIEKSISKINYESSLKNSISDVLASQNSVSVEKYKSKLKSNLKNNKNTELSKKDDTIETLLSIIARLDTNKNDIASTQNLKDKKQLINDIIKEIENYFNNKRHNKTIDTSQDIENTLTQNESEKTEHKTTITVIETVTNTKNVKKSQLSEQSDESQIITKSNDRFSSIDDVNIVSISKTINTLQNILYGANDDNLKLVKTETISNIDELLSAKSYNDNDSKQEINNMEKSQSKNFADTESNTETISKTDKKSNKNNKPEEVQTKEDINNNIAENKTTLSIEKLNNEEKNQSFSINDNNNATKISDFELTSKKNISFTTLAQYSTSKMDSTTITNSLKILQTRDNNVSQSFEINKNINTVSNDVNDIRSDLSSNSNENVKTKDNEDVNSSDDDTKTKKDYNKNDKTQNKESKLKHEDSQEGNKNTIENNDKSFFEKLIDKGYDLFKETKSSKKPEKTTTYINLVYDTNKLYVFDTNTKKENDSLQVKSTTYYENANDQIDKLSKKISDFYDLLSEKMEVIETMNQKVYLSSQISLIVDMLYDKLTKNNEKPNESITGSLNTEHILSSSIATVKINIPKENHTTKNEKNKKMKNENAENKTETEIPFIDKIINKLGFGETTEDKAKSSKSTKSQTILQTHTKKHARKTVTHTIYEYKKIQENEKPD